MAGMRLKADWPSRQVEVAVAGVTLRLCVPESPYAMLDLPEVERAFAEDEYMPYWAYLWPASMMLGQWLAERVAGKTHPSASVFRPDRGAEFDEPGRASSPGPAAPTPCPVDPPKPPAPVLEIGCGLGLAGLLAAKLGYRATLTDYDGDALGYVRRSARLNGLDIRAARIDWRRAPTDRYPMILASDVLYEQRTHQPILEFLRLALAAGGLAVLSDPCRQLADAFIHDAPSAGWRVSVQPARWEDRRGRIVCLTVAPPLRAGGRQIS